jgi:uncharacterized protein (TIGR04255 family)
VFRPVNDDHAIERVKFSVLFTRPISPRSVFLVEQNHDQWRAALPACATSFVTEEVNGRPMKLPSVVFGFLQPDASPLWSMSIGGSRVDIECYLYTRWNRVWGEALDLFTLVFETLSKSKDQLQIYGVALEVKDVFRASGEAYELFDLFKSNPLLPMKVHSLDGPWSTMTTWLIEGSEDRRTLHMFDAEATQTGDEIEINMTHSQTQNTGVDLSLSDVSSGARPEINALMESMHSANKELVNEILADSVCERIGLRKS